MVEQGTYSSEKILTLGHQASQGDIRAFGELYQYFLPKVFGYFSARVKNREVSEELTSIVFVKVAEHVKTFSPEKGMSFSGWLFRIAHNVLVDHWRVQKSTSSLESEEACAVPAKEDLVRFMQTQEQMRAVEKCMEKLSFTDGEIIRLRAWEGYEYDEVADIVGKGAGAVRMALSRALGKLRTCLEGFHISFNDIV
ncbi:sigma-70 family RNA polymerase sigma factor [bacterium]|nr:sigma-70 family RNA polymerase sigma factor [bacterium]